MLLHTCMRDLQCWVHFWGKGRRVSAPGHLLESYSELSCPVQIDQYKSNSLSYSHTESMSITISAPVSPCNLIEWKWCKFHLVLCFDPLACTLSRRDKCGMRDTVPRCRECLRAMLLSLRYTTPKTENRTHWYRIESDSSGHVVRSVVKSPNWIVFDTLPISDRQ